MLILGIETSCDETAAAVLKGERICSNIISSQLEHRKYGGVVPEIASRAHLKLILPIIEKALKKARVSLSDIEGIAVTCGPGLVGSLLVGISVAKAISSSLKIPLVGINHIEGHIFSPFLENEELSFPFIILVASGGHTQLIYLPQPGIYRVMGSTRDDAAGEAFDKVAQMLKIGYPGGPVIDKLAKKGDPEFVNFPRAYLDGFDFSFSGLKTAVVNFLETISPEQRTEHLPDIAASFQTAVTDVLTRKSIELACSKNIDKLAVAGGVAANSKLRRQLREEALKKGISVFYPSLPLCTDNGAMIARAGLFKLSQGLTAGVDLNANPRMKLS